MDLLMSLDQFDIIVRGLTFSEAVLYLRPFIISTARTGACLTFLKLGYI